VIAGELNIAQPSVNEASPSRHLRWPAGSFYWALLDTLTMPRRFGIRGIREIRYEQLGYLFERSLPLPIDDVHSVYARTDASNRYIACGVDKSRLGNGLPLDAVTLAPETIPQWLTPAADGVQPDRFNLLVGDFEPTPARGLRRRIVVESVVLALAFVVTIVLGFERRTAAIHEEIQRLESQRSALLDEVLATSSTPAHLTPDVRLTSELRTLRQTRKVDLPVAVENSAAMTLGNLLAHWPKETHLKTQSIALTPESIIVRGTVPTAADSQTVVNSFQGLPNWSTQQPNVRTVKDGVEIEVRLTSARLEKP
jgi:hypothetical protein